MKTSILSKLIILIGCLLVALPGSSQDINVRRIRKLPIDHKAYFPSFGTHKRQVVLTQANYRGISLYNTFWRWETVISEEPGAGKEVAFPGKNEVLYRERTPAGEDADYTYKTYDLKDKEYAEVEKPPSAPLEVRVDRKQLQLVKHGEVVRKMDPVGDHYYIWASLSPDGRRLLFTAAGKGTYVTDLDGNVVANLGMLNDPGWMNEEWVLGMEDQDDGERVLSSNVVARHVPSETRVNLTRDFDGIALYPESSPEAERIVFHNPQGEIFIANIRIKNP